jgi:hypothetical protein
VIAGGDKQKGEHPTRERLRGRTESIVNPAAIVRTEKKTGPIRIMIDPVAAELTVIDNRRPPRD